MPYPATTLQEASERLRLSPLTDQSLDYVDLSAARGSNCLAKLESRLQECADNGVSSAHLAFIGHRGSGKSTELTRMEDNVRHSFFPIHLYLDASLELDADYPELLLWMAEGVADKLNEAAIPFDSKHIDAVAKWFCEVTKFDTSTITKDIGTEIVAIGQVGFSFAGLGAKIIGKLKSAIKGSKEYREEVRAKIKKTGDELITVINTFLSAASEALAAKDQPSRLLIIQDNLDRLSREAALRIFKDGGETIQRIHAICVWTPPVGSLLAPFQLARLFRLFDMPMISARRRDGSENKTAVKALTDVIAARMDIPLLFATRSLVRDLILLSGGSVRELLRLTDQARLNARAEKRTQITKADVLASAKEAAIALQNGLMPNNVYFPILAEIAKHKKFEADLDGGYTPERVDARREFFHGLIAEGAVFAYNGDDSWWDVHPVLHVLKDFQRTLAKVPDPAP